MKKCGIKILIVSVSVMLSAGCGDSLSGVEYGEKSEGTEEEYTLQTEPMEANEGDEPTKGTEPVQELPMRPGECAEVSFASIEEGTPGRGVFRLAYTEDHEEDTVWYYDEFFTIERYENGDWETLPMLTGLCGVTSYTEIPEISSEALELRWSCLYGPLEPGIYCVTKNVFPENVYAENELVKRNGPKEQSDIQSPGPDTDAGMPVYAVFEITEGLEVSLQVQDAAPAGLTVSYARDRGGAAEELLCGSSYWLERLEGGRWRAVEYADQNYEPAWTDEAYLITEEVRTEQVDWEWLYGELPPGKYRFCKDVTDFREPGDYDTYIYSAEFEIP